MTFSADLKQKDQSLLMFVMSQAQPRARALPRRRALAGVAGAAIPATAANAVRPPEFVTQQPGFTPTKSGLQIKDVKEGTGAAAAAGDRVVYEWEGYTIGYFGRPFEKKAGLKGGDFEGERDYSRFVVGRGAQIKFRGTSP